MLKWPAVYSSIKINYYTNWPRMRLIRGQPYLLVVLITDITLHYWNASMLLLKSPKTCTARLPLSQLSPVSIKSDRTAWAVWESLLVLNVLCLCHQVSWLTWAYLMDCQCMVLTLAAVGVCSGVFPSLPLRLSVSGAGCRRSVRHYFTM
jgi:hypothetical protein